MKISQLIQVLVAAYRAPVKQPIMIWGPPGVGKSAAGRQAAKRIEAYLVEQAGKEAAKAIAKAKGKAQKSVSPESFGFIDLRLTLLEPIDLRGLPMPSGDAVNWVLPNFLPRSGNGILFLDEIVQANPSMQAAASQLILDRRIGEYMLPDGWIVIAAGNRKSDRASVMAMPTHIANRFVHITVEVDVDEWIEWALQNDVEISVIAFIKWRRQLLHFIDPQAKSEAFASPRSWEFLSNLIKAGIPDDCFMEVAKGTVGEGAGGEYTGFHRVFHRIGDVDTYILNPKEAQLPGDAATLYALATTLVHRVDRDNIDRVRLLFDRIKDAGRPEFAVIALKEISLKKPELLKTRAYCEWSSAMSQLIV